MDKMHELSGAEIQSLLKAAGDAELPENLTEVEEELMFGKVLPEPLKEKIPEGKHKTFMAALFTLSTAIQSAMEHDARFFNNCGLELFEPIDILEESAKGNPYVMLKHDDSKTLTVACFNNFDILDEKCFPSSAQTIIKETADDENR